MIFSFFKSGIALSDSKWSVPERMVAWWPKEKCLNEDTDFLRFYIGEKMMLCGATVSVRIGSYLRKCKQEVLLITIVEQRPD